MALPTSPLQLLTGVPEACLLGNFRSGEVNNYYSLTRWNTYKEKKRFISLIALEVDNPRLGDPVCSAFGEGSCVWPYGGSVCENWGSCGKSGYQRVLGAMLRLLNLLF